MTEPTNMVTVIMPGRRALGEDWSRVSVGHDADEIVVSREDAPAPADGKSIVVVSGSDTEYTDYILAAQYEKARNRPASELTTREYWQAVNEAWFAFLEDKVRHLQGTTSLGAGGFFQRQRVHQNPDTRPEHGE